MDKFGWILKIPDWMKTILVFGATLVGIIVGMVELVKFYQDDFALVVTTSTIVFFLLLWYLCFHFYLTHDEARIQQTSLVGIVIVPIVAFLVFYFFPIGQPFFDPNTPPNPTPGPLISGIAPSLGESVTVVNHIELARFNPEVDSGSGQGNLRFPAAHDDETLILVATFHLTEGTADRNVHAEIRRTIQENIDALQDTTLRVEVEPTTIRAEAQDEARALGEKYKASIIIWGEDTGVRITVNYLNLREPGLVSISETERTQLANPSAFAQFVTQDLPAQLTFYALFAVGQSYYSEEKYAEAVDVIEKALAPLTPEMEPPQGIEDAYFRLGWLYQGPINTPQLAIAAYTQAIAVQADNATFFYNRGTAYLKIKEYDQAIADYDQAIALRPGYVAAYYNRGNAYYKSGQTAAAIADYEYALGLRPNYVKALNNLCWVQALSDQAEMALAHCELAVELAEACEEQNPEEVATCELYTILDSRGVARALTNDYDGAIEDFAVYVQWLKENDRYQFGGAKREQWIAALQAGQNPLDEATRHVLLYGQ